MSHYRTLIWLLAIIAFTSSTMAEDLSVVKANNKFGTTLLKTLGKDKDNVLISPLSAHIVLSMAYHGAGGKTAANMAQVFELANPEKTSVEYNKVIKDLNSVTSATLNVENKIYVMDKFIIEPAFKNTIVTSYLSEVDNIDFANAKNAADTINTWVENKTKQKIRNLIEENMLNADTRLVLLNVVYFKGTWAKKFDPKLTQPKPFYLSNGQEINVNMMHLKSKFRYDENEELNSKILEIPYEGRDLSMIVFLPNERNAILDLQNKLTTIDINQVTNRLSQFDVNVELPKFKIESTMSLKEVFHKMGAGLMFSDAADFSKMAKEPLKVSDVVQKTFMEVNEEGTEAAAATAGIMRLKRSVMRAPEIKEFIANHPFIFILLQQTGSILFVGKCVAPNIEIGHDEL